MFRLAGLALLSLVLVATSASAQTASATTGTINGKVTDNTGAVLPGVAVTISSPALMGTRDTVTNEEGLYRFPAVPPGEYAIAFQLSGFEGVNRQGVRVGLGFTATVNVELGLAGLTENVSVTGASPVVDVQATKVSTNFDAQQLANMPSARDYWAILAEAPAIRMSRIDVGGSAAGTQTGYNVYGTSGQNRPMVEGLNVTEHTGGFALYMDYGSNDEVAVVTGAHSADMAVPGVQVQIIAKSGGNTYHGSVYADIERENWQSYNIDDDQIARGVSSGGGGLSPRDVNRLYSYYDFNAGLGGYIVKDRMWWYGSFRNVDTKVRVTNFPVKPNQTILTNFTPKVTYNLTTNNKFIFYSQPSRKHQPNRLDRFRLNSRVALHSSEASSFEQFNVYRLWKAEYNTVLSDTTFFEIRTGQYGYDWPDQGLDPTSPSIEDIGNNQVFGAARHREQVIRRNQVLGSLTYFKEGWGGTHNFKFGGEIFRETSTVTQYADDYGDNVVHILRNGAPLEVTFLENPSISENGMWAYGSYVVDTFRVNNRLTLNLGARFDRYRNFLPEQEHAAGRFNPTAIHYDAVDDVNHYNVFAPRVGATFDLGGDGKTVIKVNYGQYWWNPGYTLTGRVNPNPPIWSKRYAWADTNRNGVWNPGEEGRLIAVVGGAASTRIDPNLKDTYTREAIVWLERELIQNFGVRTGLIWRGERQESDAININQPFDGFTVPVLIPDPGPDGRIGNADDGAPIRGFNLASQYVGLTPVNLTTNIPNAGSDYYTWEITGTKRMSNRWSLLASFSNTWNRKSVLPKNPNDLINRENGRDEFTDRAGKLHGTIEAGWGMKVTPKVRYQTGTAFGRGVVASFNYANPTILSEPVSARRYPRVFIVDFRAEKVFRLGTRNLSGFIDLFNLTNANPAQDLVTNSGTSFLRPTNIVPPRLLRIGTKFEW